MPFLEILYSFLKRAQVPWSLEIIPFQNPGYATDWLSCLHLKDLTILTILLRKSGLYKSSGIKGFLTTLI